MISEKIYFNPLGILSGCSAGHIIASGSGWSLAGGTLAYSLIEIITRNAEHVTRQILPFQKFMDWVESSHPSFLENLKKLHRSRPSFAGLSLKSPVIMGIVNVTPDSFSDGGKFFKPEAAIQHALKLANAGADILDIGGESTRPNATPVSEEEEIKRVIPVIQALAEKGLCVSIDTHHASVMELALKAGAKIINDITALSDPKALKVASQSNASVILMHMQGTPQTMQLNPVYDPVELDIFDWLSNRIQNVIQAGIPLDRICIDPGIGFGKKVEDNVRLLQYLGLFQGLGCPILLGTSRKSFIANLSRGEDSSERLPGSLTSAILGLDQGVQILRVHDVAETKQACNIWQKIKNTDPIE